MDGTYFLKKFLLENLFRRASSVVVASHRFHLWRPTRVYNAIQTRFRL